MVSSFSLCSYIGLSIRIRFMKFISAYHLIMTLVASFIDRVTPFVVSKIPSMTAFENEVEKTRSILKWSEGLQKRQLRGLFW